MIVEAKKSLAQGITLPGEMFGRQVDLELPNGEIVKVKLQVQLRWGKSVANQLPDAPFQLVRDGQKWRFVISEVE